jgi:signal transduction histidine kinase/ActR/RegA family two-component response regulator
MGQEWWLTVRDETGEAERPGLELIEAILDQLPDAVTVSDAVRGGDGRAVDMRLRYMNGTARAGQVDPDGALGQLCTELWPQMVENGSFAACMEVLDTGEPAHGSFQWTEEATYRPAGYDWRAVRVGADALVWVLRDESERLGALHDADTSRREAELANRAKSEFLSRMSHELRTPLSAVLGFARLLEMDELTADQEESVALILRAGHHLLGLIDEVLDLARIEVGGMALSIEPVDVVEALEDAPELVAPMAATAGITLAGPGGPDGPTPSASVRADRQRLVQVLLNLLSNAVKYNRPDGRIDVAITVAAGVGADAADAATDAPPTIAVSVADTGPGIPDDRLEDLFVPFERLGAEATDVEGTGVGLSIARELAGAMGGQLDVASEVGRGSTFTLRLPGAEAPEPRSPVLETDARPHPAGAPKRRVVYIEDNSANLRLIERVLQRRADLDLVTASHGQLGLDLVRQERPALVLLDLHLPDISGEEVLAALRADPATADLPVAILSADATTRQVDRLLEAGADRYLTKPVDVVALLEAVDELTKQPGDVVEPQ